MLKKVLKDGAEKAGIDDEYFEVQCKQFKSYQEEKEKNGHPSLDLLESCGVMIRNEVKVHILYKICLVTQVSSINPIRLILVVNYIIICLVQNYLQVIYLFKRFS